MLMLEILSHIFKMIVNGKVWESGLKPEWSRNLTLKRLSSLLSLWLNNLIFFENIEHINYPLIETFITILLSKTEEDRKGLIGKKNDNVTLVLKLICISLDQYCFD
mmetsp:Transcript_15489/g.15070  ORF Transcript_15489/g.15070 Transcript_15489/m.15070 type:complete len:106 (+) Transcript_15489:218-535(+)